MILFFSNTTYNYIVVETTETLSPENLEALCWLFGDTKLKHEQTIEGWFVGPRPEMITPWSTNAVEITQNMNIQGITRIEEFFLVENETAEYDPMLQHLYHNLDQNVFITKREPTPIQFIEDIERYNEEEGLALSAAEIAYLHNVEKQQGRRLTDSEIFGFAQINSEHCRHKIFGGTFIIRCPPAYLL